MKKLLYKTFPGIPAFNLKVGQFLYPYKLKFNKKGIHKKLESKRNIYANIGCGDLGVAEGWVNIDIIKYNNVTYAYDCRKELPFADNSAKAIYTEHFFEHLDYSYEAPGFLAHAYRSLQPGGILRIIVPDAEKYLLGYAHHNWDVMKQTRPLDDNLKDGLMGVTFQTKMQLVNEVFRQDGNHKYAWDFETLKLSLEQAGFTKIFKMSYLYTHDDNLKIDRDIRRHESLYVEAIK